MWFHSYCVRVLLITIACSILVSCSASTPLEPSNVGVYAPAKLVEPFVPNQKQASVDVGGSSLSLEELLIFADEHAPSIRTSRARVGLADAQIAEAAPRFVNNPEVSVSVGHRGAGEESGVDFEVAVQQQVEIVSGPQARRRSARDQKTLALAVVNEVRWSVHVEVHRLFVEILLAHERVRQAERFVEFSRTVRDIARSQIKSGDQSPLIGFVAESDYAQTREKTVSSKQRVEALRVRLAAVIGWPRLKLPPLRGELPKVRRAPDMDVLLGVMMRSHPSLRTREIAIQARNSQLDVEEREGWVKPVVGVQVGREAGLFGEESVQIWTVNVGVPIPLWRSNQGGKARARAQLGVAEREREAGVVRLRSALSQTVGALNAAVDRVELFEEGVIPQLEQNLALLLRAYELGEVNMHQVSQTRERLLNAMEHFMEARIEYHAIAASLEGLVGAEVWPTPQGEPQ